MTVIGDAFVRVRPDTDGFEDETKSKLGGALSGVAKAGAAALATVGAAAATFGAQSVMAASDLGESISKVNVVFGDSAQAILDWGKSADSTLLLSQQQALDAAGSFGNLFSAFGMNEAATMGMSTGLVQLAQDLSSFNNIPVEEALDALRAGMTGETEPLKKLGASFSAAELEAKALSMGLVDSSGEMDNAAKAQAAYALIMERTTNAQGDAARTADGLANQLKILKADATDTMAGLGQALMPVATELVGSLGGVIQDVAPMLADAAGQIAPLLSGVISQIGPLMERIMPAMTSIFGVLAEVMEAIPWDMVVLAVGNIAGAVGLLMPSLKAALVPMLEVIGTLLVPISSLFGVLAWVLKSTLLPVIEALSPVLVMLADMLASQLNGALKVLMPLIIDAAQQIGGALGEAITALVPVVMDIVDAFLPLLPLFLELVSALLPPLTDLLVAVLPIITDLAAIVGTLLAGAIRVLVSWMTDYLVPAFQKVVLWITDHVMPIVEDLAGAFGKAKEWISDHIEEIVGFVTGLPARLLSALSSLASAGLDLGRSFLDGLKEGITAVAGFAGDIASAIVGAIKDAWNVVANKINDFVPNSIGWGAFSLDLPDDPIPTFHTGGVVPGGPTAEMLALLQGGETVRTRAQEQAVQTALQRGTGVAFYGPVTFGTDMGSAVAELDWMARYSMAVAA